MREKVSPALFHLYMLNPLAVVFQQFRHAMITPETISAGEALGGWVGAARAAGDRARHLRPRVLGLQPLGAAGRGEPLAARPELSASHRGLPHLRAPRPRCSAGRGELAGARRRSGIEPGAAADRVRRRRPSAVVAPGRHLLVPPDVAPRLGGDHVHRDAAGDVVQPGQVSASARDRARAARSPAPCPRPELAGRRAGRQRQHGVAEEGAVVRLGDLGDEAGARRLPAVAQRPVGVLVALVLLDAFAGARRCGSRSVLSVSLTISSRPPGRRTRKISSNVRRRPAGSL